jgi:Mitochondrial carrier protein
MIAVVVVVVYSVLGAVAWTISFPLDLVRAHIQGQDIMMMMTQQQQNNNNNSNSYQQNQPQQHSTNNNSRIIIRQQPKVNNNSSVTIMIQLVKQKGIMGLYSGVIPSILRAFLVSGSRFSAYEGTLYLLRGGRDVYIGP